MYPISKINLYQGVVKYDSLINTVDVLHRGGGARGECFIVKNMKKKRGKGRLYYT